MNKKPTKVSTDKTYLKHFSLPGFSQSQVMARVGKIPPELENFIAILDGVLERTKNTKDGDWADTPLLSLSGVSK